FARHKLHDEVGAAFFLAVVIDVGDALVVDEGSVAGLGAETLEKAGVAEVLVFQDFDGDGATDDKIARLPHLAHAANGDAVGELVAPTEREAACGSHLFNTASMTCLAIGAATALPKLVPFSTTTATAI